MRGYLPSALSIASAPLLVLRNLSEKQTFRDLNLDQPRNKAVEILGKDAKANYLPNRFIQEENLSSAEITSLHNHFVY